MDRSISSPSRNSRSKKSGPIRRGHLWYSKTDTERCPSSRQSPNSRIWNTSSECPSPMPDADACSSSLSPGSSSCQCPSPLDSSSTAASTSLSAGAIRNQRRVTTSPRPSICSRYSSSELHTSPMGPERITGGRASASRRRTSPKSGLCCRTSTCTGNSIEFRKLDQPLTTFSLSMSAPTTRQTQ